MLVTLLPRLSAFKNHAHLSSWLESPKGGYRGEREIARLTYNACGDDSERVILGEFFFFLSFSARDSVPADAHYALSGARTPARESKVIQRLSNES